MADSFLRGHEKYRRRALAGEGQFLRLLASEGQSPDALFIGCSDSRVVPELLTNSSPGSLFVVRNIANVVPPLAHADASVGAAIEYAIGHLGVGHAIVCGHTGCGGVKAAMEGLEHLQGLPSLQEWLTGAIGPAIARVRADESAAALDETARWRRVVEQNVLSQLANLLSFPAVAERVKQGDLQMHGWVYDLHDLSLWVFDDDSGEFQRARDVMAARG